MFALAAIANPKYVRRPVAGIDPVIASAWARPRKPAVISKAAVISVADRESWTKSKAADHPGLTRDGRDAAIARAWAASQKAVRR